MTANDGTVRRGARAERGRWRTLAVGESAGASGRPSRRATSRGPVKASLLCAVRTLSTSSRSTGLPRLAERCWPRTTSLSSCTTSCADRITVAEAGIERQPVGAVDVHQVLAHLRGHRPLVEERDLVEPAALAGHRMTDDGAAALPGAQPTIGLPLRTRSRWHGSSSRPRRGHRCRTRPRTTPRCRRCSCGRAASPRARSARPAPAAALQARRRSRPPRSPRRWSGAVRQANSISAGELERCSSARGACTSAGWPATSTTSTRRRA